MASEQRPGGDAHHAQAAPSLHLRSRRLPQSQRCIPHNGAAWTTRKRIAQGRLSSRSLPPFVIFLPPRCYRISSNCKKRVPYTLGNNTRLLPRCSTKVVLGALPKARTVAVDFKKCQNSQCANADPSRELGPAPPSTGSISNSLASRNPAYIFSMFMLMKIAV